MANTYSPILTKGTEADLKSFVEGKLRFTVDTGRIFLDTGASTRIEYTDFVKGLTETQILALTTGILPKVYMSSDTFKLFYYDTTSSTWKSIASEGAVTSVNSKTGDVVLDASDIGLGNVGNFKAVSTESNQGLNSTEQDNARTNIGLGTAAVKNVPSSGDAGTTEVVMGDDTRLTDARNAADVYAWAKAATKPTYTASEVGLDKVGNFKAVSTEESQGLTTTEKSNARSNIGLGTAAVMNTAVSGNADTTEVVKGDDTRLSDARPASDVSAWAKAASKPTYTANEVGAIPTTEKGANNGVATLDSAGKIPSSQLPSAVDEIIEGYFYNDKFYEDYAHTIEITGETSKIYVDLMDNKTYRFSGTSFVEISASLALGETSSTAYRGDRGKTAYDHSQITSGNPHNVTKSDVGLGNVGNFKAVSTVASQGLSTTEQANARANIGAGTSSFDGQYSSLTGAPSYNLSTDRVDVTNLDADYINDIYQRSPKQHCALTFDSNLVATVSEPGITSETSARVYYQNPEVAKAAKITSETDIGVVRFTAQKTPTSTVIVDIFYEN